MPPSTPTQDLESKIHIELQLLLMGNLGSSLWPGIIVALILLIALSNPANTPTLLAWCLAVSASKLFDVADARRWMRRGIVPAQVERLRVRLMCLHAVDGAVWGALAWLALPTAGEAGRVLILAVLAGIAANSMSILSPVLPVFAAFLVFELGSMAVAVLMLDNPAYSAIGVALGMYAITLMGQAYNTSRTARHSIQLRFDNLELIEQLSLATQKAEGALAAAKLANEEKSRFLAAASHDLRQPIHAQSLFLEVLKASPLTQAQQNLVQNICSAANATTDMLHTLLDYSRIEAGVIEPQVKAFRLGTLLGKIENELAPLARAKGLSYRSVDCPHALLSDPALVELIVRNLVSNAIRYTERGGVLVLARRKQETLSLEVWDTGIGIPREKYAEIFREFHQLGNSERDRQKGLGLGLAIAQKMAHILGIELSLASRVGRGSVFKLRLPLAHTAVLDEESAPMVLSVHERCLRARVLFVDDDAIVRQGMAQLLETWGCEVQTAESLEEALVLAQRQEPDLVISDYRLREERKGSEVIAAIRARLQYEVPALLLTGDTAPIRLREARASGLPLLHKPVLPQRLYEEMELALQGG